jgi:zinc protease
MMAEFLTPLPRFARLVSNWVLLRPAMMGLAALIMAMLSTLPPGAEAQNTEKDIPVFDIPFEKRVLSNGLTVIIHHDDKTPVVAVGVWYHVGSRNEPAGKSGYAHLFEHLMFEGTENFDQEYTLPLEAAGATRINGSTWFDRTNYIQNVPTPALELALWMESDRMGHLLGALTQEKLDRERQVVINEKNQGDDEPYGLAAYRILEGLFPPGHPYRRDSSGSIDDLSDASLDDIHEWFRDWYGAANAVLVMAGDVEPEQGFALAEQYFGHIAPGPPLQKMVAWVPDRRADTKAVMHDRVPHVRSYRYWAVPGTAAHDRALLELAAAVLGDGKNSRLYQALVYRNQYVLELEVNLEPHELTSMFSIDVTLTGDASTGEVDAIIDQEMSRFLSDGPGSRELERAKTALNSSMIRGLEEVGGFSGKAATLAHGELYADDPGFVRTQLNWMNQASEIEVRDAARRWLTYGRHQLDVIPFSSHEVTAGSVNRSQGPPQVHSLPVLQFPEIRRNRLSNGMEVILAARDSVPVVNVSIQFDAGFAADHGGLPGTASFALAMLDQQTHTRNALEIDSLLQSMGARVWTGSTLDSSTISLSAMSYKLEPSLELFADVIQNPAFREEDIQKMQNQWFAVLEQELTYPLSIALRTLPPLLYGEHHPYGIPFTGSGTRASIEALDSEYLSHFHSRWLRPDNATIFVTGDTSEAEILPVLEQFFGRWKAADANPPKKIISQVELPPHSPILIVDHPGATQSLILAAQLTPPSGGQNDLELEIMNDILGGTYNARLNQTLRVENSWSYGVYSLLNSARGQRPWMIYAPVQADRTTDAIRVLSAEIEQFTGPEPTTPDELAHHVARRINSLPARFETNDAIMEVLLDNQRFGRPDDYAQTLKDGYRQLALDSVRAAATHVLDPSALTWVVIGDRSRVETALRSEFGERVTEMKPDGTIIQGRRD